MATPLELQSATGSRRSRPLRSTAAVVAGFLVVAAVSVGIDEVLHVLGVYPPWGQPMYGAGLNALALSYRVILTVLGGYVTARLAPHAPMRHAMVLGFIGLLLSVVGAIATLTTVQLGPAWYPISLVITAVPATWIGAALYEKRRART